MTAGLDAIAALLPEVAASRREMEEVARRRVEPGLLDLAERVIEMNLTGTVGVDFGRLDDRSRAFARLAEQFVVSVADIDDAHIVDTLRYESAESVYDFICALYVIESARRVDLVAAVVLG